MTTSPDLLTSLANVQTTLGITDQSENNLVNLLIPMISALVAESVGRPVLLASNPANPITEYLSGQGDEWLNLRYWPVQAPYVTGGVAGGSSTLTNLSSTLYLFVNQPVVGPGIAAGTTVTAVGTSQVTLSQPATANVTGATFQFLPAVWLDDEGYYGQAPGAFAVGTQLQAGTDYFLRSDQPDGSSRSGQLGRVWDGWDARWQAQSGLLAAHRTGGKGNVKVQYVGGWQSVPQDLELAVIRCCAKCRNSKWYGDLVASESFEDQAYSLQQQEGQVRLGLLAGDVAPVLARYRRIRLGE